MLSTTFTLLASLSTVLAAATPAPQVQCPGGGLTANAACCALFPVLEDITQNMFTDGCGDAAHTSLRVVFHDAIGFSQNDPAMGGGADGSIFIFGETEVAYPANLGIADAINLQGPFIAKHNISVADFLHFAGAVSVSLCPGTVQQTFMFGRTDATFPAPDGTVPVPTQSVDVILQRMADAGFSPEELVALLASHSIAGADDVDPFSEGLPFDSTPSVFDTQIFVETQLHGIMFPISANNPGEAESAIPGELRLLSDFNIARDPRTSCAWQANVDNQAHMASTFQAAFAKLQVLGQDVANMVDCSDVIPAPPPLAAENANAYFPPGTDQDDVDQSCAVTTFPVLGPAPGNAAAAAIDIVQNPLTNGPCADSGAGCNVGDFAAAAAV
jgi:hypothetical protein